MQTHRISGKEKVLGAVLSKHEHIVSLLDMKGHTIIDFLGKKIQL